MKPRDEQLLSMILESDEVKMACEASESQEVPTLRTPAQTSELKAQQSERQTQPPQDVPEQRVAHVAENAPAEELLQEELTRERTKFLFFRTLRSTVFSLVVVAAAAVLVAVLVLPILQISGNSMTDTLQDQDIVVALRGSNCETGDVVAFYFNNKILVKRVIARSGQWVNIDNAGNVFVDGVMLDEPYVADRALGDCNIKLPYQVPESRVFVMGDHRSVSIDSRNTTVGCIAEEQIVGKLLFCAWPFERFGAIR